jgi:hypothetical protein
MRGRILALACLSLLVFTLLPDSAHAASSDGSFSIDVSPSHLVSEVKPGTSTSIELRIRNAGLQAEHLKIETRAIANTTDSNKVNLSDSTPSELSSWITYADPTFTVQPGQWFTEKISINIPASAGFSYPFAVVISRVDEPQSTAAGRLIKGSVGVFALINVDKPGATRKLDIAEFKPSQSVYEFLPSDLTLVLRNSGNTIVQPYGNIFIQRGSNSSSPLAALQVNAENGYILPGTTRTFQAKWDQGFPAYKITSVGTTQKKELVWDWNNVSKLRIGRYTAKLVAVYSDGRRDIPVVSQVTFWVIPWRILLAGLVVLSLLLFGIWTVVRTVMGLTGRLVRRPKP